LLASFANEPSYEASAITLAKSNDFSSWRDGGNLIDLVLALRFDEYEGLACVDEMVSLLENRISYVFDEYMSSDDLETLSDKIDKHRKILGSEVIVAMERAIVRELDECMSTIAAMDSKSTLSDHTRMLERLGKMVDAPAETIAMAISRVEERLAEIKDSASEAPPPQVTGDAPPERDIFDNVALQNLFDPLASDQVVLEGDAQ
jgi:hypothetical protein